MSTRDDGSPVVRPADLSYTTWGKGERFAAELADVTDKTAGHGLGARMTVVAPGKAAWPYHCHHGNDELFVILAGEGELRYGGEAYAVAPADVVHCPAGGPETAHQLVNTGTDELRYLAVSTMNAPDVMEYPDSGKVAAFGGAPPGGDKARRRLAFIGRKADAVDYWDGEV